MNEVNADNLPIDTVVTGVSYFKPGPKCVHQPCENPVVAVRMTTIRSESRGRGVICASVCEQHIEWEQAQLKQAIDIQALNNQPERN